MSAYLVEAAWKLGQWEHLSEFLQAEDSGAHTHNWNIGLGSLLQAVRDRVSV